jgi:transposase InsO family protein
MKRLVIDLVDLKAYVKNNDGKRYLLNVVDAFTQYVWAFALTRKTAVAVQECLLPIFDVFGPPSRIQSDNGGEFIGKELKRPMAALGIKMITSSPYHPASQERVERLNMTFEQQLGKVISETNDPRWTEFLPKVVRSYNCTVHNTTNQEPFRVMFGRPPPVQWMTLASLLPRKLNAIQIPYLCSGCIFQ